MNAVTFMDAMKRPTAAAAAPPAEPRRRRMSPNAALIAGVGTLLLAMGVGVLIGRSGDHSTASTPAAPQIIKVPAGGAAETAATAPTDVKGSGGKASTKASKQSAASAKKKAETGQGAEEVLKPSGNVKLPPATVKPGGKCESGTAGCKGEEFTGEFFGE